MRESGQVALRSLVDIVVVGAGLTGLAHAYAAHIRGLRVAVVEQDAGLRTSRPTWSGLISSTAQHPQTPEVADRARESWLEVEATVGLELARPGTVLVARSDTEAELIEEFCATRPDARSRRLTEAEVTTLMGGQSIRGLAAAAYLPLDMTVDPREAEPALQRWLEDVGVGFHWDTRVGAVECGGLSEGPVHVLTSRGLITAGALIHCAGHGVGRLFPEMARGSDMVRCHAMGVEVAASSRCVQRPAVLTGSSMLSRAGLADTKSADDLFEEFACESPDLLQARVDLSVVPRPSGGLFIGSTHSVDVGTHQVGGSTDVRLLLDQAESLLGVPLTVQRNWTFTHAALDTRDLFVGDPDSRVRVVTLASESCSSNIFDIADAVLTTLS